MLKYRWKDSVNVFTTIQARTKRSKVMPGGGPWVVEGGFAVVLS